MRYNRMMKKIAFLLVLAAILFIFFGQEKNRDKLTTINLPANLVQQIPTSLGSVLGESTKTIDALGRYYPQKIVEDTIQRASKQVSSDAQEAVSAVTNDVISGQFVNTYKTFSPEVQKQVKESICKSSP